MRTQENIARGVATVGQQPAKNPGRKLAILTKDFSSVEQGVPIPVIYGRPKPFAGITVTPIFGFRSKKMTITAGK